jgi:hypothetical protein
MYSIPLRALPPSIPKSSQFVPWRQIDGRVYGELDDPIFYKSASPIGLIRVFDDVTDQEKVLVAAAKFNLMVAAVGWLIAISLVALYVKRMQGSQMSCAELLRLDESDQVEFKSSLRWDYATKSASKKIELQVIKAVTAFMNSRLGGTVAIGIRDDKEVLGLDPDYSTLRGRQNRDGLEQALQRILIEAIGRHQYADCVRVHFCSVNGKEFCLLYVSPSSEPVFTDEPDGKMVMYLRVGNTTRSLDPKEAVAYARDRWGSPRFQWPWRSNPIAGASG